MIGGVMRSHLKVFKALGDKNRLRIVKMLEVKPMCVCEITAVLNLAPSTVSKHLSLLHEAGLTEDHKEGKWVNYALARKSKDSFISKMLFLLQSTLEDEPGILADKKTAGEADRIKICG